MLKDTMSLFSGLFLGCCLAIIYLNVKVWLELRCIEKELKK